MKWDEFIGKLKDFKEKCAPGQLNINAGSLTTLLFAGGFDSMIDKRPLTYKDYHELCAQMKVAINSEAQLPKAKSTESLGIADIDSDIKLNMWRFQVNPLHQFRIDHHFSGFLAEMGFRKADSPDKRLIYWRPAPESDQKVEAKMRQRAVEVWDSWRYVFENKKVFERHSIWTSPAGNYKHYPDVRLGFLGMIQNVSFRPLKDGRESYTFKLFLGGESTDDIRVWSNEQGFVPHATKQYLKNGNVGVALVKINKFNDRPSGSLDKWLPAGKWEIT